MNVACSVPGCTNPVIGQCIGYKGSCGRYYCAAHSIGKLCTECAEKHFHELVAEKIYQDYLQAAGDLLRERKRNSLVILLPSVAVGLLIWALAVLPSGGDGLAVCGAYWGILLLSMVPYGLYDLRFMKQRFAELGATRPRFEGFYRAYAKQKSKENLGKTLAVAGVLGGIALGVEQLPRPRTRGMTRRGTMTPTRSARHNYRLELEFRRAVQRVPNRQRPSLRTWLRRYRCHRTRVFHELDPATGHWRRP